MQSEQLIQEEEEQTLPSPEGKENKESPFETNSQLTSPSKKNTNLIELTYENFEKQISQDKENNQTQIQQAKDTANNNMEEIYVPIFQQDTEFKASGIQNIPDVQNIKEKDNQNKSDDQETLEKQIEEILNPNNGQCLQNQEVPKSVPDQTHQNQILISNYQILTKESVSDSQKVTPKTSKIQSFDMQNKQEDSQFLQTEEVSQRKIGQVYIETDIDPNRDFQRQNFDESEIYSKAPQQQNTGIKNDLNKSELREIQNIVQNLEENENQEINLKKFIQLNEKLIQDNEVLRKTLVNQQEYIKQLEKQLEYYKKQEINIFHDVSSILENPNQKSLHDLQQHKDNTIQEVLKFNQQNDQKEKDYWLSNTENSTANELFVNSQLTYIQALNSLNISKLKPQQYLSRKPFSLGKLPSFKKMQCEKQLSLNTKKSSQLRENDVNIFYQKSISPNQNNQNLYYKGVKYQTQQIQQFKNLDNYSNYQQQKRLNIHQKQFYQENLDKDLKQKQGVLKKKNNKNQNNMSNLDEECEYEIEKILNNQSNDDHYVNSQLSVIPYLNSSEPPVDSKKIQEQIEKTEFYLAKNDEKSNQKFTLLPKILKGQTQVDYSQFPILSQKHSYLNQQLQRIKYQNEKQQNSLLHRNDKSRISQEKSKITYKEKQKDKMLFRGTPGFHQY